MLLPFASMSTTTTPTAIAATTAPSKQDVMSNHFTALKRITIVVEIMMALQIIAGIKGPVFYAQDAVNDSNDHDSFTYRVNFHSFLHAAMIFSLWIWGHHILIGAARKKKTQTQTQTSAINATSRSGADSARRKLTLNASSGVLSQSAVATKGIDPKSPSSLHGVMTDLRCSPTLNCLDVHEPLSPMQSISLDGGLLGPDLTKTGLVDNRHSLGIGVLPSTAPTPAPSEPSTATAVVAATGNGQYHCTSTHRVVVFLL